MVADRQTVVYLDGEFVDPSAARVSLFDRGYLFGDSVFATMRGYGPVVFRLREHLARLETAAVALGMALPRTVDSLASLVREAVSRVAAQGVNVRVTVSRGEGPSGLDVRGCDAPVLSIIARPLLPYPAEAYSRGIRTMVLQTRRVPAACLDPAFKTGNYLSAVIGRRELEPAGLMEGIQLAMDGSVVSGTISNLFLVQGTELLTPHLESGCRPGMTREVLLACAAAAGLTPHERRIEVRDLVDADEVFFANTIMECLPIREIDSLGQYESAPGPRTRAMQLELRKRIEAETMTRRP